MEVLTQLACFKDIHEDKPISPSELIDHLRNGTISRTGLVVYDKDHKYVVLRHKERGTILYFMIYDYSDTDIGFLAEYARNLYKMDRYDLIGFGTFALKKMKGNDVLVLLYKKGHRYEARLHYLDSLRDEVRQELANLFDMKVQIKFDLRAISAPTRNCVFPW